MSTKPETVQPSRYRAGIADGEASVLNEPVGVSRDSQTVAAAELPEESSLNDYDVNNEVAIALALVNQRSLSSLTEKQRETVRQLRAGVQATTSSHTDTEHNDTTASSMPTKQAANNPPIAQKPPPAIVPQTNVAVTKTKPVQIAAQISECSAKTCKKRELVIDNETAKIDKNEIVVDNSSNVTKQEALLSTDCDLIQNTQHKKSVKSKVHKQGTKEQAGKKLHQRRSPTQNIGTRRVKTTTKPLLQKQTIIEPKQQLKPVQHKKRIHESPPGDDKHDLTSQSTEPKPNSTTTDQEKSRIFSDTSSYIDDQVTSSVQSKVQSPLGNPQVPMAAALPRHSKQEEADSQSIEQDTTNETNSKSDLPHPIEWEEPVTPEEIPPNFFNHPNKREQQLTPLPAPQDFTEDNKQLSNDEKPHALIHFAQELVINDFLTWKRGPLGTIEHVPTAHIAAVSYWDSSGQPTQWTEDFADDLRNEPAHIKTNPTALFSPIHTPSDIGTPHLTLVQTVPMETLQFSPVPHSPDDEPALRGTKAWQFVTMHEPALRGTKARQSVTTHEPALRGTKAWQLPNNVFPPRMIDTSVQTDSIEPDYDYSTSAAVLLPPVAVRGLQRPHNPGGHSRPCKKSKNDQSETIREARKDKPEHDREDKMKAHIVKSDKWSRLENDDKKPIKSLKSPSLNPSHKKSGGGYLSRYLHSDGLGGLLTTEYVPGSSYRDVPANQLAPWYGGLNNTAPPSIVAGNSPLHINRSHPVLPHHMRRKLSSGPYQIHSRRVDSRLKPMQQQPPPTTRSVALPGKLLSEDPFHILDSSYKHKYSINSRKTL